MILSVTDAMSEQSPNPRSHLMNRYTCSHKMNVLLLSESRTLSESNVRCTFLHFQVSLDQLAQLWIFQDLHFRGRLAANENLSAWWMENTGRAVMSDVISDITWIDGDQYFISIMIKHRMRVTAPDRKAWLYNECRNCTYLERSRKARSKSSEAYVWSVRGV